MFPPLQRQNRFLEDCFEDFPQQLGAGVNRKESMAGGNSLTREGVTGRLAKCGPHLETGRGR